MNSRPLLTRESKNPQPFELAFRGRIEDGGSYGRAGESLEKGTQAAHGVSESFM